MANEYKQCPNGHYYQGAQCPYCKTNNNYGGSPTSTKTEVFENQCSAETETIGGYQQSTIQMPNAGSRGGEKTTVIDGGTIVGGPGARPASAGRPPMSGRTIFGDEDKTETVSTPSGEIVKRVYRETRKLVGWLVSYTLDPMGIDFKLYEGRNIIGRDMDCNITVNDSMVSSRHAVLLFRAGKYSITDSQSSHGTFVNNRDIELEPCYLSDGDIIQIGQTTFKFRTSF